MDKMRDFEFKDLCGKIISIGSVTNEGTLFVIGADLKTGELFILDEIEEKRKTDSLHRNKTDLKK